MTDFNKLLLHTGESNYDHAYWQQPLSSEYQNPAGIPRSFEGAKTCGVRICIHSGLIIGSKYLPPDKDPSRHGENSFLSSIFNGICIDVMKTKRPSKMFSALESWCLDKRLSKQQQRQPFSTINPPHPHQSCLVVSGHTPMMTHQQQRQKQSHPLAVILPAAGCWCSVGIVDVILC